MKVIEEALRHLECEMGFGNAMGRKRIRPNSTLSTLCLAHLD